jgi:predicted nucleotidyltransferase
VLLVNDGTFLPKNNKSSCGCGTDNKKAYERWLTFNGAYGTDILDLPSFGTSNDLVLNGVAVKVDLKCRMSEIICTDEHPMDFLNDGNAMNMAYAIRFKAGIRLFEQLLSSDQINRFTLLNRDHALNKIREWSEIYQRYIEDTCKNTNRIFDNDCLICRDTQGTLLKRNIKV